MKNDSPSINFGVLFLALILIAIGVIYFLNAVGVLNVSFTLTWNVIWPLILILIGLSLLSRRGITGTIVGLLISLVILGVIALIIVANVGKQNISNQTFEIKKDPAATSSVINIKTGAVKVSITSGAQDLVEGNLETNFMTLNTDSNVANGVQTVTINGTGVGARWFSGVKNVLDIKINSDLPCKINLDTGAASMDLNFSEIKAENIDIDTGASSLDLTIGDKVQTANLNIKAGASSLNIVLPKTIGAKLTIDSGLSSKNLSDFSQIDTKTYQSTNYNTTDKKINIDLDLGVSSLNINWK